MAVQPAATGKINPDRTTVRPPLRAGNRYRNAVHSCHASCHAGSARRWSGWYELSPERSRCVQCRGASQIVCLGRRGLLCFPIVGVDPTLVLDTACDGKDRIGTAETPVASRSFHTPCRNSRKFNRHAAQRSPPHETLHQITPYKQSGMHPQCRVKLTQSWQAARVAKPAIATMVSQRHRPLKNL